MFYLCWYKRGRKEALIGMSLEKKEIGTFSRWQSVPSKSQACELKKAWTKPLIPYICLVFSGLQSSFLCVIIFGPQCSKQDKKGLMKLIWLKGDSRKTSHLSTSTVMRLCNSGSPVVAQYIEVEPIETLGTALCTYLTVLPMRHVPVPEGPRTYLLSSLPWGASKVRVKL